MGSARPTAVRLEAIRLKQTGWTHAQVAEQLKVSLGSVRNWWRRYCTQGYEGLEPNYAPCGRPVRGEVAFRLIRLIKHYQPEWGVPYIVLKIQERYPHLAASLCSVRQYQRRLRAQGLVQGRLPASRIPRQHAEQPARVAHDSWQIDAKERLVLQDGQAACYLSTTDEASGAILAARVFPPRAD